MGDNRIRAVLFDLGETLLCFDRVNVIEIFREAAHHSCECLKEMNQPVDHFMAYLWKNLLGIRVKLFLSHLTKRDFDSLDVLKKHGRKKGIDLTDAQWEEVNWSWYELLSKRASFEPDLAQTLDKLTHAGLKLGLLSNTFVNSCSLERHLEQEGLLHYFCVKIYSYNYPFRKPDTRIFQEAARKIDVPCGNIMFVGDNIKNDVKGSVRAGMIPVLKKAYTNRRGKVPEGTAVINRIHELPELIAQLNGDAPELSKPQTANSGRI